MPKASLLRAEKANANDGGGFLHRPAWMDPAQFNQTICRPECVTLSVRRCHTTNRTRENPDRSPSRKRTMSVEKEEDFVPARTKRSGNRPAPRKTRSSKAISRELSKRIGEHKYDMWFGHARMAIQGDQLDIATDSEFVANWIGTHFADDLRGVAEETLGKNASINVHVAPNLFGREEKERNSSDLDAASPVAKSESRREKNRKTDRFGQRTSSRSPALKQFSKFIVGESNRLAYSAATRLVQDAEASPISPLFIHAECGLGKTHLLQGICHCFAETTGRPNKVRYITAEQFTNDYITAIRENTLDRFRAKIRKLDLLAIDDVHFFSNKVRTQSEFLHTLDEIDLNGSRVVLASDEHPRKIRKFSQALISRFLSGMVVKIERPDRSTRIELIRQMSVVRGLRVSQVAVEEIATHCVGSIRELEGAITKLYALKTLINPSGDEVSGGGGLPSDEIGLVIAQQLFKDQGWQPTTPIRMGTILDHVCDRLAISRADLMSSGRHRRVVLARALVAYLGRDLTTQSYPEIARELGRSYHSTVHTAAQRLKKQMLENANIDLGGSEKPVPLRELVDQLRHEILKATGKS